MRALHAVGAIVAVVLLAGCAAPKPATDVASMRDLLPVAMARLNASSAGLIQAWAVDPTTPLPSATTPAPTTAIPLSKWPQAKDGEFPGWCFDVAGRGTACLAANGTLVAWFAPDAQPVRLGTTDWQDSTHALAAARLSPAFAAALATPDATLSLVLKQDAQQGADGCRVCGAMWRAEVDRPSRPPLIVAMNATSLAVSVSPEMPVGANGSDSVP